MIRDDVHYALIVNYIKRLECNSLGQPVTAVIQRSHLHTPERLMIICNMYDCPYTAKKIDRYNHGTFNTSPCRSIRVDYPFSEV
jgi:hypothetical protein